MSPSNQLTRFQRNLLNAAIRAPSGDNSQPWAFRFSDDRSVIIEIVPSRAQSFFDYQYRATYLSVGAVIENIRLQAVAEGAVVDVRYGARDDAPVAATLRWHTVGGRDAESSRVSAMMTRTVNRRPFLPLPIRAPALAALMGDPVPGTSIRTFVRRCDIARWARIVELGDRIRYSHPVIHRELFAKLLFTPSMAHRARMGLEVNRLGLGPLGPLLLRWLEPWERVERWSRWGLTRILAAQSGLLARASGALVLVLAEGQSPEAWMRAGEQVQRLWVRAHETGWRVHPMPVSLYLDQRYQEEGEKAFLPMHAHILHRLRDALSDMIGTETAAMLFRLGRGPGMPGQAVRLPAEALLAGNQNLSSSRTAL